MALEWRTEDTREVMRENCSKIVNTFLSRAARARVAISVEMGVFLTSLGEIFGEQGEELRISEPKAGRLVQLKQGRLEGVLILTSEGATDGRSSGIRG